MTSIDIVEKYRDVGGKVDDVKEFEKHNGNVIKKLVAFFEMYPHIQPDVFILVGSDAPFEDMPKMKTVTKYAKFWKMLEKSDYDSPEYLQFMKRSGRFIRSFCKEREEKLSNYPNISDPGAYPAFLTHIKEKKVALPAVFVWDESISIFERLDTDILAYYTDKVMIDIVRARQKLEQSKQAKNTLIQTLTNKTKLT